MLLIHTLLMPALRCFDELLSQCSKKIVTALAVSESGAIRTAGRTNSNVFRRSELSEPVRKLSNGEHCNTHTWHDKSYPYVREWANHRYNTRKSYSLRWALPMEDVAIVTIPGVHLKRIWGHCRTREIAVNLPVVLSANSVHILNEARPASFGQGDLGKIHSMMGGSNWRVGVYDCLACLFIEIGIAN